MTSANFYTATLAQALTEGGSETTIYVSSIQTLDGETLNTSDFTTLTKGYITIDPQSSQRVERISFTGVDPVNTAFTGVIRGLYNKGGGGAVTSNAHYHPAGSPVILSFGADDWNDILAYIASIVVAGTVPASTSVAGVVQLPTQAQVDARTLTGSTGAYLAINTSVLRSTLLSDYAADSGSANAYVINPTPIVTAYTTGQIFSFKPANTNTTASTLNVSGLGTKNIFYNGAAVGGGMIVAGAMIMVEYDGTQFQMVFSTQKVRTFTTTTNANPSINTDALDYYELTAQAVDITSFTTNLTGTPKIGQTLWISITGTATRNITWGAKFESSTTTLPAATISTNRLDVGFIWNNATSKWRCVALS